MAIDPDTRKISAFVVESDWPGVSVEHRCRFMGLRALSNAVLAFKDVRVPAENLIGQEGKGLKIALTSINDGRALADVEAPEGASALRMADVFCRSARRRVEALFRELWSNDDALRYGHGLGVLSGQYRWLEAGILEPPEKKTAPVTENQAMPVGA